MFTSNMALLARTGALDLIGPRAEEHCKTLPFDGDPEAIMNEVALALFEEACRRRRSGLRGVINRIVGAWRRFQHRRHPDASGEFGVRMHAKYGVPPKGAN